MFGEAFKYDKPLTLVLAKTILFTNPFALVDAGKGLLLNTAVSAAAGGVVPPAVVQFAAVDQFKSDPAPDHVVTPCAPAICARQRIPDMIVNALTIDLGVLNGLIFMGIIIGVWETQAASPILASCDS